MLTSSTHSKLQQPKAPRQSMTRRTSIRRSLRSPQDGFDALMRLLSKLDDRVRYPGLLAAYLPCGRVSQVAAKEARLPTRTSLLAPTCRIDGWMLHRTRSDNGQLGPIYALTCEARVAESMRESWGLMDYSTRGRGMTNKQQARRRFESRAWWTLFLEARRRSRERPSAHDRGSSGD